MAPIALMHSDSSDQSSQPPIHSSEEIRNASVENGNPPRRKEKTLPKFELTLPKFHFILPNFYFVPPWGIFVFHEAIGDFLGGEEIRG